MARKVIMGHWYNCQNKGCGKNIPIPNYIFLTHDGEKKDEIEVFCPFCDTLQFFKSSEAKKPCSKKEALSYFKKQEQIKVGNLRFESYWGS